MNTTELKIRVEQFCEKNPKAVLKDIAEGVGTYPEKLVKMEKAGVIKKLPRMSIKERTRRNRKAGSWKSGLGGI